LGSWLGNSLTLDIERVAHGGHFISHHEGRVVFVTGALPGETVLAEVTRDNGAKFCFARVTQVIVGSPNRVPHFWEAADRGAGGAEFGHIRLDYQRELKGQVLRESMDRFASQQLDTEVMPLPADLASGGLHYRTRLQLHARNRQVGVMQAGSTGFIPISDHPLAIAEINSAAWLKDPPIADGRFSLWADSAGEVGWQAGAARGGASKIVQRVAELDFSLSPGTFWQAHFGAPDFLFDWALEQARRAVSDFEPKRILELYSGAGLFTAALLAASDASKTEIISVEQSQQAVADAANSLEHPNGVEFWVGDVLEYLRRQQPKADVVFLDPPRSGASGKVTEQLLRVAPKSIIYLACDPVALARDAATLLAAGYQIASLTAADLFPHTHHFETLAHFQL